MTHRILIVDDEEQIRFLLRRKMELCGYEVEEAVDGGEAIDKLEASHFDLLILDIFMPERDGFEVLMHLKRYCESTPVIVTSGSRNEAYLSMASDLGACRLIPKPFELAEIAEAAESLLATATDPA